MAALIKFTPGIIQIKLVSLILNLISLDNILFERVLMVEEPKQMYMLVIEI